MCPLNAAWRTNADGAECDLRLLYHRPRGLFGDGVPLITEASIARLWRSLPAQVAETERQTLDTVTFDTLGTNSEQLQAQLNDAVAVADDRREGSVEELLVEARAEIDRLSLGYVGLVRVVAEHAGHSASAVIEVGTDGGYSDETVSVTVDTDGQASTHTEMVCSH